MSSGPGSAERALLDATSRAVTPLGARVWLTLAEAWASHTGTTPTGTQANALRRAGKSLARKGMIEVAHAGDVPALFSSPLRQDLRRGTVIVAATRNTLSEIGHDADQGKQADSTEYVGEERRRGRVVLAGMLQAPLKGWNGTWRYRPTREQLGEAGRWASTKLAYGYNDLRSPPKPKRAELHYDTRGFGGDWDGDDDRRAGQDTEAYLAARERVGIRGGPLRTESVCPNPAPSMSPEELPLPPRGQLAAPFTAAELEEIRRGRWRSEHRPVALDTDILVSDDEEWELLTTPTSWEEGDE